MRYARKYRNNGDKVLAFHYHDLAISTDQTNAMLQRAMVKV